MDNMELYFNTILSPDESRCISRKTMHSDSKKAWHRYRGLPGLEVISQTMTALHTVEINRGLTALYVYCNLCEPQIVGDTLAPLLRIVDSKGKDGQNIVQFYGIPHFVSLRKKYIDVIEMNISDDTGNIISFTSGKVICKLHIRLKQPSLF